MSFGTVHLNPHRLILSFVTFLKLSEVLFRVESKNSNKFYVGNTAVFGCLVSLLEGAWRVMEHFQQFWRVLVREKLDKMKVLSNFTR